MTTIAVQYLESAPEGATPARVRSRLRRAFETLPISMVLLGWHLPARLEEAAAAEASHHGADLYRWHPLLASDTGFHLPEEWRTVGYDDGRLAGFEDMPEFTFLCPNRADVRDWISERIESEIQRGLYQGFFFDRMRFPSPAEDFPDTLTCFCNACRRVAADSGLDLETVRRYIRDSLAEADGARRLLLDLFESTGGPSNPLRSFMDHRQRTITGTLDAAATQVRSNRLSVGLDCFSPALTRMVGQDLRAVAGLADWTKIMTYPRVFGPAGLPFELFGLADWLLRLGQGESDAMRILGDASRLPMPARMSDLRSSGLGPEVVRREVERARKAGVNNVLAGLALVEMRGVHESTPEQIRMDSEASLTADGLVLSWELWDMPVERLQQIRMLISSGIHTDIANNPEDRGA